MAACNASEADTAYYELNSVVSALDSCPLAVFINQDWLPASMGQQLYLEKEYPCNDLAVTITKGYQVVGHIPEW